MTVKAIVTDIEGTTSSLSFVKDVLFPYARQHMAAFITENETLPAVAEQVAEVKRIAGSDLDLQGVIDTLTQWIDEDQKITPLKALQGMIWQAGYENGDFTGHVYADAHENLKKWQAAGIKLYVFSSGSVKAQKLIFGFSDFGDMTSLFSGYFDTNIGAKREAVAYENILAEIDLPATDVLFLSDIEQELDAAKVVGLQVLQLVRPEDGTVASINHSGVKSFNEVALS